MDKNAEHTELPSTEFAKDEVTLYADIKNDICYIDEDFIEYLNKMKYDERFSNWVIKYAKEENPKFSNEDAVAYIKKNAKELLDRTSIDNWFKGKKQSGENNEYLKIVPRGNAISREKVYKLCFALKMNAEETRELFYKGVLERPFNYKDIKEATYYFCLNTNRDYEAAKEIIEGINSSSTDNNPDADNVTEVIGKRISKI